MIINDLYNNNTVTYWTGTTYHQYQDIFSESSGSHGYDGFVPDAYWMGWISKDNIPVLDRSSHCTINDSVYTFEEDIDDANFPITYASYINSSGNVYQNNEIVRNENGSNYNNLRFINQMYPEYSALYAYTNWQLYGHAMIYDAGENLVSYRQTFSHGNITTNPANIFTNLGNFLKFYEYGGTMQMSFGSTYGTITISSEDFRNGTFYVESTAGYFIRGFFTSYSLPGDYYITHQNDHQRMQFFYPFVSITCNSDGITQYSRAIRGGGYTFNNIATLGSNGVFSWLYDNSTYANKPLGRDRAGMHGTIDTNLLTSVNPYTWNGNVLCILDVNDQYPHTAKYFYPIITMDDVYKTLALNFRVDTRTYTNGYVNGSTYATDVTENNEFLARLKTGDIENPEFKNSLRPWQYDNFQLDDFEPGDVPPYVPPGPGPGPRPEPVDPGDDETGGDDYEPNNPAGLGSGFGFVTQYAIRAAHLTDLGSKLWEGFFSEDEPGGIFQYMNNFIFAVNTDTGSVNFSDIMNFFISLRAYPCPVSAMASTSAGGQDMYVGSGSKPIHLNTTFSIVNDMIGTINAGELSVPYWFGDYRDYSLECIVYLPYCGTIQLNPGDIMGGTLSVNYTVDFCSGACVAYVLCTTWEGKLLRVGSLQGQLGADVPMTATNAGQVAARMYGDRIDAAETFTGALKSVISGGTSVAGGNYGGAVSAGFGAFIDPALQQERLRANMGSRGAISAPMLSAGRGLSGFADSKTVFLQIRSPIYAEPDNYDTVVGMPSTSAVRIGDCSGFCQFINVDVSGITTDLDDQQTIRRALESGIII